MSLKSTRKRGREGRTGTLYTGCQKYTHTRTVAASMNLQLQLRKVEKLSLSAPTKFVMSRLLANVFVKPRRQWQRGGVVEGGGEVVGRRHWEWASRGVDCMTGSASYFSKIRFYSRCCCCCATGRGKGGHLQH